MSEILETKKGDRIQSNEQKFVGFKGEEKWEGSEVQVESAPLIDPNVGDPHIIRTFMFKANPEWLKKNKGVKGINKQELFNNHWKQLQLLLWSDGLVPDEEINPKITFRKDHYFIQITCKARMGVIVTDSPKSLNELLKKPKNA